MVVAPIPRGVYRNGVRYGRVSHLFYKTGDKVFNIKTGEKGTICSHKDKKYKSPRSQKLVEDVDGNRVYVPCSQLRHIGYSDNYLQKRRDACLYVRKRKNQKVHKDHEASRETRAKYRHARKEKNELLMKVFEQKNQSLIDNNQNIYSKIELLKKDESYLSLTKDKQNEFMKNRAYRIQDLLRNIKVPPTGLVHHGSFFDYRSLEKKSNNKENIKCVVEDS
jgi:hypothetical protein